MEERIKSLNKYLNGWLGYYSLSDTEWHIGALDGWLRRRMRLCSLHQWKKSKTRIRELRKLGASEGEARRIGYSRKGNWRLSMTPQIHKVMGIDYWKERGLVNLVEGYNAYRQGW